MSLESVQETPDFQCLSQSVKGAPFFWHLSAHDASAAVAHVAGRVWSLNVLSDSMSATPLAVLPRSVFQARRTSLSAVHSTEKEMSCLLRVLLTVVEQVPQLCRGRVIFVIPQPPGGRAGKLIVNAESLVCCFQTRLNTTTLAPFQLL